MLLSLDVHVVQKVMWAGRFQTTARKQIDLCLEVVSSKLDLETLETVSGVLQQLCNWHFVQENAGIEPHGLGK